MNNIHKHFADKVPVDLRDYVDNVALLSSRYMFVESTMRIQYGYCTHCKQKMRTQGLRHGQNVQCEKCKSSCVVKATGRGRKMLIDEACVVWYGKSRLDASIITAITFYVYRDYRGDYRTVETKYEPYAKYIFRPGNITSLDDDRFGSSEMLRRYCTGWGETSSIISEHDNHLQRLSLYLSYRNVNEAVSGTPLQYSSWEDLHDQYDEENHEYRGLTTYKRAAGSNTSDLVRFFDVAARYPCTEYLMKAGFEKLVLRKAYGNPLYNVINWKGKSLLEVMRLSKTEFRSLMDRNDKASPFLLRSYHFFKRKGASLNFEECRQLVSFPEKEAKQLIYRINVSVSDAVRYVLKQLRRPGSNKIYTSDLYVLRDWADYLNDCQKLEMNIKSNAVKFPNDLHKAHQKTMKKVKYKEDKELSNKIEALYPNLMETFSFESDEFIVRPIQNAAEIFAEAKILSHCVGGYAQKHADGKTTILVVRRREELDKPFYTVEIADQTVRQCRGYKNCAMTDDVNKFIAEFAKAKLKKQPAKNMRGVAV